MLFRIENAEFREKIPEALRVRKCLEVRFALLDGVSYLVSQ